MQVVIALGTNQGDREAYLRAARAALESDPEIALVAASPVYETEPLTLPGSAAQPPYLNAAVAIETTLGPETVLARCLAIERRLGRVRAERWGPRTIDLDLLYADDDAGRDDGRREVHCASATLTLPHPQLTARSFALAPLCDVRPDLGPRFEPTLRALGGRPPIRSVEGWTSLLRLP